MSNYHHPDYMFPDDSQSGEDAGPSHSGSIFPLVPNQHQDVACPTNWTATSEGQLQRAQLWSVDGQALSSEAAAQGSEMPTLPSLAWVTQPGTQGGHPQPTRDSPMNLPDMMPDTMQPQAHLRFSRSGRGTEDGPVTYDLPNQDTYPGIPMGSDSYAGNTAYPLFSDPGMPIPVVGGVEYPFVQAEIIVTPLECSMRNDRTINVLELAITMLRKSPIDESTAPALNHRLSSLGDTVLTSLRDSNIFAPQQDVLARFEAQTRLHAPYAHVLSSEPLDSVEKTRLRMRQCVAIDSLLADCTIDGDRSVLCRSMMAGHLNQYLAQAAGRGASPVSQHGFSLIEDQIAAAAME